MFMMNVVFGDFCMVLQVDDSVGIFGCVCVLYFLDVVFFRFIFNVCCFSWVFVLLSEE